MRSPSEAASSALSSGLALGDVELRVKALEREGEDSEFEVSLIPATADAERVEEDELGEMFLKRLKFISRE
ncbi:unnamed protein product [Symbiodinium microadriaticum]|nr:unnamed protein product [Symbiodinium microadriaticum]